jgi:aspartyl-tRNA(Asn)/glutamyl-tRNA(Gln) amidotransferase subunit B
MEVTRIHLEEDTANNKHDRGDFSLVDFNRAGVPLMELVTEPHVFKTDEEAAKAASNFAKELQLILWYLGVSEANMEKGEMRVEANVSVSDNIKAFELNQPVGLSGRMEAISALGTKVEVKNLNSFRSVERAIKYEVDRMIKLLEEGKGDEIVQETRGWDESKQKTFSQRKKEGNADYRYFPDPDLPKMKLHEAFDLEKIKKELPELPSVKRAIESLSPILFISTYVFL